MDEQHTDSETLATQIVRRANALNVPINRLCREAGVSPRWFFYFRTRSPKSVELYARLVNRLAELEEKQNKPKE